MRVTLVLAALVAVSALASQALAATARDATPVVTWKTAKFGVILSTKKHLAIYTWRKEPKGKIRCVGACAKMWPPITVPKGTMVAKHVKGVMGSFGTTRRPDGRTQVTLDGHALYTYEGDSPTKILCNGVDGWYVKKA